jgi:hypothetical protein
MKAEPNLAELLLLIGSGSQCLSPLMLSLPVLVSTRCMSAIIFLPCG